MQLVLAKELDLPVIIHSRLAHSDLVSVLREFGAIRGVVHCFNGSVAELEEYLDLGLCIGLNGIIFKKDISDAIKKIPANRILLETDCPFLSPLPEKKRNEPKYVLEVAQRVSQIRNESVQAIIGKTVENAKTLFKLNCQQKSAVLP